MNFLHRKESKELFWFPDVVKILVASLTTDVIVSVDSKSFLRLVSISKAIEIKSLKLSHLAHFVKITSYGLILVICVENKQTFIYLFDPEGKLIQDISIEEKAVACDIAYIPNHKEYLVLGFDSFSLKLKSEKSIIDFQMKHFIIPQLSQFLFVQSHLNDIQCIDLFQIE
jgi:hypothetical protein